MTSRGNVQVVEHSVTVSNCCSLAEKGLKDHFEYFEELELADLGAPAGGDCEARKAAFAPVGGELDHKVFRGAGCEAAVTDAGVEAEVVADGCFGMIAPSPPVRSFHADR